MQKYTDVVLQAPGAQPLVGASVQVNTYPGGIAATIYSNNGVTVAPNPTLTDGNGRFAFYAADGRYSLVVSKAGFTTQTIADVLLEDPATSPSDTLLFSQSPAAPAGTVSAKLQQIISVKDAPFNALGDGVTDDTAAINAVEALPASVTFIYVPDGTYITTLSSLSKGYFGPGIISLNGTLYGPGRAGRQWGIVGALQITDTLLPAAAGSTTRMIEQLTLSGDAGGTTDVIAFSFQELVSASNANNIARIIAGRFRALHDGGGLVADLRAQSNDSSLESTGSATNVTGVANRAGVTGTGSITNECANFKALVPTMTGAGTCLQMTGYTMQDLSAATITTVVGFQVPAMTASANIRAFQGSLAAGATRYNLYMDGTATNFLGGPLQVNAQVDLQTGDLVRSTVNGVAEISINFTGYNGGTTQFRNFTIYDGKNATVVGFTGSTKAATFAGLVSTPASTTAGSGLRVPHGTAPTSPVDGDVWSTTTTLNFRLNGVTKSVTLT